MSGKLIRPDTVGDLDERLGDYAYKFLTSEFDTAQHVHLVGSAITIRPLKDIHHRAVLKGFDPETKMPTFEYNQPE